MLIRFYYLFLCLGCFLSSGCQSVAIKITQHLMEGEETHKNVRALQRYADKTTHRLNIDNDLAYGKDAAEKLDVVYPREPDQAGYPVIFLVHGGGWVAGSKLNMLPYAKLLAVQGFVVVNIEYSLVPTQSFPRQLKQLDMAISYVQQHAQRWPGNLHQTFLSGDSAGANIVSSYAAVINSPILQQQLALTPRLARQDLKGLVMHSGVYDLTRLYQSVQQAPWATRWIIKGVLNAYSGQSPTSARTLYAMSALPWLTSAYPPVWLSASENDLLTEQQSRPFIARLQHLQVPVEAHIFSRDWPEPLQHDFEFIMKYQASQRVLSQSVKFMQTESQKQ